jgi:hypothetical protein
MSKKQPHNAVRIDEFKMALPNYYKLSTKMEDVQEFIGAYLDQLETYLDPVYLSYLDNIIFLDVDQKDLLFENKGSDQM